MELERIKNIADLEQHINEIIASNTAKLAAWENVKRLYKKDGSAFKNLQANFSNCKINACDCSTAGAKEMTVYYKNGYKYESDYLRIDLPADNLKDYENSGITFTKKPEQFVKQPYIIEYYFTNVDEIEQLIKLRIQTIKNRIADYKKQLEGLQAVAAAVDEITKTFYQAEKELNKYSDDTYREGNYYVTTNILKYGLKYILKNKMMIY